MGLSALPPLIVFDADGTLRWTVIPGQPCPNAPGEWRLLPGVAERLRSLEWGPRGHKLGVASNQNGVALGYLSAAMARRLLRETVEEALGFRPEDAAIEMCTCSPDRHCPRRKPEPGMLCSLLARFQLEPRQALFVGDLDIDREAARRAGVAFAWAHDFFGQRP